MTDKTTQFLYWLPEAAFQEAKAIWQDAGVRIVGSKLTPCEVLKAAPGKVVYATPELWSRICVRQGSWYRESARAGQTMMMSLEKLPERFDKYLDAELSESDFKPARYPSRAELEQLVQSEPYQTQKPDAWEKKGLKDAVMFKLLFSVTRFWGWGDNLRKHWLGHRANHANFVTRKFTTKVDGDDVPYSITDNAGVCSSCVEFFNIVDDDSRKLVNSCPGAVTFGGAKRDTYLDVKPYRPAQKRLPTV